MIKFNVKNQLEVKLPTHRSEITKEILEYYGSQVNVGEHRTLIALISSIYVRDLPYLGDKKKNGKTMGVIPVFVKAGKTDSDIINVAQTGDAISLNPTAIELGTHIRFADNKITNNDIAMYVTEDDTLRKSIISANFFAEQGIEYNSRIYTLDFKIIANSDIAGIFDSTIRANVPNFFVNRIDIASPEA